MSSDGQDAGAQVLVSRHRQPGEPSSVHLQLLQAYSKRDRGTFGSLAAFDFALLVEMYRFPLTIDLLSGWLAWTLPGIDPLSH